MDSPGFLRDTIASSSKSIERPGTRQSEPLRSSDMSFEGGDGSLTRSSLKRYSIIEGGEHVQGPRRGRDRERRRNRLSRQDLAEIVGGPGMMMPVERKISSSPPPCQVNKEDGYMSETVRLKSVSRGFTKAEGVWSTGLAEKSLNFDQEQHEIEIADRASNSVRDRAVRIASPESVRSSSSMSSSIAGPPLVPALVAYESSAARIRQGGRRVVDKCGLGSHDSLDALRLYTKENFEVLHQAQTRLAEYIGLVCQDIPERQSELTRRVRQLEAVAKDEGRICKKMDQLGREIGTLDQSLGVLYKDTQDLGRVVSEVRQQSSELGRQVSELETGLCAVESKCGKGMTHFCDQLVRCESKFKADVWYLDDVISDVEDSLNQVLVRLETAGIGGAGAPEEGSNYGSP